MRDKRLIRTLAWLLIGIGLVAAAPVLVQRWRVEGANRQVDLVLDLPAYRAFARQEGYPLEQLLTEMRAMGATSLAIPEMDLKALSVKGLAAVGTGAELRQDLAASGRPNPFLSRLAVAGELEDAATYLLPVSVQWRERLYGALRDRLGPQRVQLYLPEPGEPGAGAIALTGTREVLEIVGAGFDPADFELARRVGLRPLPRPRSMPAATPAAVEALFADILRLAPEANSILFGSKVLPGWRPEAPEVFDATIAAMERGGYVLDMVEHYTQLGFAPAEGQMPLAEALDYRVARVYSMSQKEFDKYLPHDAMEKLARSVLERNIRVLYLRPWRVWQDPGLTPVETNHRYFQMLTDRIQELGHLPGGPDVFPAYHTPWWQRGFMALAAVGAGVLWLSLTWPFRRRFLLALTVLGIVGSFALLYVAPRTGAQGLALVIAILFPTLAGTELLVRWGASARRDVLDTEAAHGPAGDPLPAGDQPAANHAPAGRTSLVREGAAAFFTLGGLSLLGGLLVAGMLGDVRYLLEFDYFRGVKLTLMAPLALVAFSYLTLDREGHPLRVARQVLMEIGRLLNQTVRYRHVLIGLVALLAVAYYIQRSGNFPLLPVADLELTMRSLLERLLVARPRTKEFAVAYPALALTVVAVVRGYRGWLLPLMLAAMTGGSSIVNTFSHLRTPWAVSLLRTVHGFWLGALVGVVGAAVVVVLLRWFETGSGRQKGWPSPRKEPPRS